MIGQIEANPGSSGCVDRPATSLARVSRVAPCISPAVPAIKSFMVSGSLQLRSQMFLESSAVCDGIASENIYLIHYIIYIVYTYVYIYRSKYIYFTYFTRTIRMHSLERQDMNSTTTLLHIEAQTNDNAVPCLIIDEQIHLEWG